MSATAFAPLTLPAALRRGVVEIWRVLPNSLIAGLLASATLVPVVVAGLFGAPAWLLAFALLPPALGATALAGFAARVLRHEALPPRAFGLVDPVLALLLAGGAALAGLLLAAPGAAQLVGAALAALLLIVGLPALAYGAVRSRTGLTALRGGAILAIARPGWSLTLAASAVLAGFAVAATAGVLALAAGPMLLGAAVSLAAAQLEEIDHLQGAVA